MKFTVEVKLPPNVTRDDMREYILQAVRVWAGSKDPDDPIYELDPDSVRVK